MRDAGELAAPAVGHVAYALLRSYPRAPTSAARASASQGICNPPKEVADWRSFGRRIEFNWESCHMDRRTFLRVSAGGGAFAATGGLAQPALSQGATAQAPRVRPTTNPSDFRTISWTQ